MAMSWEHACGALLGVFIGDAAGATLEMSGPVTHARASHALTMPGGGVHDVGRGQVTDDSELSIALAMGLVGHHPSAGFPADAVAEQYSNWYFSAPFDVGGTCSVAFSSTQRPLAKHMRAVASRSSRRSEANGALMRVIPLAIWMAAHAQPLSLVAEAAKEDAMLSHPNIVCQECNAAYAITVAHLLMHPGDADGAIAIVTDYATTSMTSDAVRRWLLVDSAATHLVDQLDCMDKMGHVRYAFTLAFHFLRHRTAYKDAVLQTLLKGGDTDTNAAIVGGLLGALHGVSAIPNFMKDPVLRYEYCSSSNPPGRPRPLAYSPMQIQELIVSLSRNM